MQRPAWWRGLHCNCRPGSGRDATAGWPPRAARVRGAAAPAPVALARRVPLVAIAGARSVAGVAIAVPRRVPVVAVPFAGGVGPAAAPLAPRCRGTGGVALGAQPSALGLEEARGLVQAR